MNENTLEQPVYIGLGSNLMRPARQIRRALQELGALPRSRLRCASQLYRSKPLTGSGVPAQADYINAVALLMTQLAPEALLDELHWLESWHGRQRPGIRWGPRPLDLDILLYADLTLRNKRLSVPHPGLEQRAFVLLPLHDCTPSLRLPSGVYLRDLLSRCDSKDCAVME